MKKLLISVVSMGLSCLFLGIISILGLYYFASIKASPVIPENNQIIYLDKNHNQIYNEQVYDWISLDDISPYFIDAIIATEDKKFYSHNGFDYLRIIKAGVTNLMGSDINQGASTITQQYARTLYLSTDKTWERKIKEGWYSLLLETHFSKDEILEGYLNTLYFGHGINGLENASQFYFNKSAHDLNLAESSMLAGIPNAPSYYSPLIDEERANNRQALVLHYMHNNEFINDTELLTVNNKEIIYYGKKGTINLLTTDYFIDGVNKELLDIGIDEAYVAGGGIKIITTYDMDVQSAIEDSILSNLDTDTTLQTSIISVNPNSGAILGLAGGKDYSQSQFNRALEAKRQVGSTMKGILYYGALEAGFTPSSKFLSEETTFVFSNEETYSPANFGELYPNDEITLAEALAVSDNIYAVKTHLFLGANSLISTAHKLGIEAELEPIASLPLGTEEIKPYEITNAYLKFASGGKDIDTYFIERVETIDGEVLYNHKDSTDFLLNPNTTYILNELLTGMFDYRLIGYTYPTGLSLTGNLTKKYAGKSGATDTDSWMIGYNPNILTTVWVGYDDGSLLTSSDDYKYAKRLWLDIVESEKVNEDDSWYEQPSEVVGVIVNPLTGQIDTQSDVVKVQYYLKGTEPSTNIIK